MSLYKKNISGLIMDYSYILNTSLPQKEKLLDFRFSEAGGSLVLKKEIAGGQFYAEIKLSENTLAADVFETSTNEKYVLYFKIQAGTAYGKWTNLAVLARNKDKVRVLLNNRCYNAEKEKKVEEKNCFFIPQK